jgi:hypothetical protein
VQCRAADRTAPGSSASSRRTVEAFSLGVLRAGWGRRPRVAPPARGGPADADGGGAAPWIAVAILAAAVVWLGLALLGAVRELAAIRERLDAMQAGVASIEDGLPVGTPAPAWEIVTPEENGLVVVDARAPAPPGVLPTRTAPRAMSWSRRSSGGRRRPAAAGRRDRSRARATPERGAPWVVGAERADRLLTACEVRLSPHVFVIDDSGFVVAHGVAADLDDVRSMLRGSEASGSYGAASRREAAARAPRLPHPRQRGRARRRAGLAAGAGRGRAVRA